MEQVFRWVQAQHDLRALWDGEALQRYEALHDRYSLCVRDLTYEMRGFYLKNAQLMSTRDEFVPPQYMAWCKETQDNCPTEFGPGEARAMAARELGRGDAPGERAAVQAGGVVVQPDALRRGDQPAVEAAVAAHARRP